MNELDQFRQAMLSEAKKGLAEGGIPIGSILVIDGKIVGKGHNRRVQRQSVVLHAEMDCLENAGRMSGSLYKKSTLFSTLSPCEMCSGAVLMYGIPRVVIGENQTFKGPEEYLKSRGVKITNLQDAECIEMMKKFIQENPKLWFEDIGL